MTVYNRFSPKDDARLRELVEKYGENNWRIISSKMCGRTYRQVKDRWLRYLSPDVNLSPWTEAEDELLSKLIPTLSPHWNEIASHFPGRTDIQIKTRSRVLKNLSKEQNLNIVEENKFIQPVEAQPKQIVVDQTVHKDDFSFDEFIFDLEEFEFTNVMF